MITRYTLPEQLSSRYVLQLSPQANQDPPHQLSQWTELHPSRLLPPYAIQSMMEMGRELMISPQPQLCKLYSVEESPQDAISQLRDLGIGAPTDLVFSSPIIVEEGVAGESVHSLIEIAKARGWDELPSALAIGVFIAAGRGLAHLHSLGFTHGAISSEAISIRYVGLEEGSALVKTNRAGGVKINHWVQGQLFQLSIEGERYGRGPEADCRALLWVLLEMLGAESTVVRQGALSAPSSQALDSPGQMSPRAQRALEQLPPPFAEWVIQSLITPPKQMGVMLTQLQRVLSANQPAFDPKGISRWLTRLAPERAQQWDQVLDQGSPQSLQHLLVPGGILTTHRLSIAPSTTAQPSPATDLSAEQTNTPRETIVDHEHKTDGPLPISSASVGEEKKSPSSATVSRPSEDRSTESSSAASFLERLDQKLDHFESKLIARITPRGRAQTKLRIAILWLDTIRSIQDLDLSKPITVGSDAKATIKLPFDIDPKGTFTLFTPSGSDVLVHAQEKSRGWVCADSHSQRRHWAELNDPSMTCLKLGGKGLIQYKEFAIFFQLQQMEAPQALWTPRLPIPTKEAGLFWCIALAACCHLALLTIAYGSKSYSFRERGVVTTSKFVEVLTQKIEEQKKLEEEEEEIPELSEEVADVSEATYEPKPERELPRVREEVRELAQARFGKGQAAVDALASFLSSESSAEEGKLALGDVSAALGTSADSGLSLGSAFGEAGGSLNLGSGGGALNTSGGLGSSRQAGQLKAKQVNRKVRGRVKALKSRARVTGGRLSREEVLKVIQKHSAKLNSCYESQLAKSPNLNGKLTVQWVIKSNGQVGSVSQVLSSLKSAALKDCVFKVIKTMKFPKPQGGDVKVKYPFVFQQG